MKQNYARMGCSVLLLLGICTSAISGCAVFRATGRSVEAVGEGVGHAVSGTGEAISGAARETKRDLIGR